MEFPKIGDKYRNNNLGHDCVVFDVDKSIDRIQLKDLDGQGCDVSIDSLPIFFTKISSKIELGSRWLLPNGRLVTVSSKDHGRINYYFGEAYCFTKVRFSKYESNFLSECSPFTGNLNDYDVSGNYAPTVTTASVSVGNTCVVPTESEEETNIEQEIFDMMYQKHVEDVSNEFIYGSDFKNWSNLKKYIAKLEDTNVLIVCGSQKQADDRRAEFTADNEKNVYGSHNFMMGNVVQVVSREYEGTCFKADLVIFDDCDNLDQNAKNNRLERLRFSENPRYEVWEQDSQVSSTGMMFAEKKPLWKRILRKLV